MSTYKVGDKVLVKAKLIGCTSSERCMLKVDRTELFANTEEILPASDMTAEEAWEIAKRLFLSECDGIINAFSDKELKYIFGTRDLAEIVNGNTPQQAKSKIEAWEAAKEIKVGDEVIETSDAGNKYIGVVTQITSAQNSVCIVYSDGSTNITLAKNLKKTGRHIDIGGILNQIGGSDA